MVHVDFGSCSCSCMTIMSYSWFGGVCIGRLFVFAFLEIGSKYDRRLSTGQSTIRDGFQID